MKKLIAASNNKGKIREIQEILAGRFEVVSMSEAGVGIDVEETGSTFLENALIKAETIFRMLGAPVVSDDSGLCVEALGGAPGVYSARFAGGHDDDKNNALLLEKMKGVADRRARFVSAVVFYYDRGKYLWAEGSTEGEVLPQKRGEGGFGYDPLFYSYDLRKSFGEATDEEKNAVSHRGRALAALVKKIDEAAL